MGFPGAPPPNPRNNIVEEYLSPDEPYYYVEDYSAFKRLSDEEKVEVVAREAQDNGMEKPLGWNVSFHYNPHVEYHHFGSSHPMKPWRLTLTKQLVVAYGLEYTMDLYTPRPANFGELALFHDREYLEYLSKSVTRLYGKCILLTYPQNHTTERSTRRPSIHLLRLRWRL